MKSNSKTQTHRERSTHIREQPSCFVLMIKLSFYLLLPVKHIFYYLFPNMFPYSLTYLCNKNKTMNLHPTWLLWCLTCSKLIQCVHVCVWMCVFVFTKILLVRDIKYLVLILIQKNKPRFTVFFLDFSFTIIYHDQLKVDIQIPNSLLSIMPL